METHSITKTPKYVPAKRTKMQLPSRKMEEMKFFERIESYWHGCCSSFNGKSLLETYINFVCEVHKDLKMYVPNEFVIGRIKNHSIIDDKEKQRLLDGYIQYLNKQK